MIWITLALKYHILILLSIFFFWVISLMIKEIRGEQFASDPETALKVLLSQCLSVAPGIKWRLKNEAIIGRAPDCDITLPDHYVSSHHARIYLSAGEYFVEDLGSTNGTFLNNKPLLAAARITPGDQLEIGRVIFTLTSELNVSRVKSVSYHLLSLSPGVILAAGGASLYWGDFIGLRDLVVFFLVAFFLSTSSFIYNVKGKGDPFLFLLFGVLVSLSLIFLYRIDPSFGLRQSLWVLLGLAIIWLIQIFLRNYQRLTDYKYLFIAFGMIFLFLTILLGTEAGGARSWLALGSFRFQPSEAVKIFMVIFLAGYLDENREIFTQGTSKIGPFLVPDWPYLGPLLATCGLSLLLLVFQRDLGMALLFFTAFLVMVYIATHRFSYFLIGILLFLGGAVLCYHLFPHVQARIAVYINPWQFAEGGGYQIIQSLFALGNGGLFGWGLGSGFPELIPAVHTDFIFSLIGEELGLAGTLSIVTLYLLFVWRGLRLALQVPEGFGSLLVFGFSSLLALQTLIILGGVVNLIPLTGIPLPFLSYGGSSLISNCFLTGTLLKVSEEVKAEQGRKGYARFHQEI
ncbi:MAG: FtsW/RodA/SpoVE family cell cycle protein [Bacillota bacterium]|nr:FtsW/RodA/SpoVE family cell cycle protein [Bacillota bacterium]